VRQRFEACQRAKKAESAKRDPSATELATSNSLAHQMATVENDSPASLAPPNVAATKEKLHSSPKTDTSPALSSESTVSNNPLSVASLWNKFDLWRRQNNSKIFDFGLPLVLFVLAILLASADWSRVRAKLQRYATGRSLLFMWDRIILR
jgi:hypothetical protein